jgi:two-component system cell cycle response regulator DivK
MESAHALIIDDDAANNAVLAQLLHNEGVTSTILIDPTAIKDVLADELQFDVVFLDLEMPQLDGYEVYDLLAEDANFASVPIVACSVHTNEMAKTRRIGLNGFLSKPLDPNRFPDQLARLLNGESVWDGR